MNRKIGNHFLTDQMDSFIDEAISGNDIKAFAFAGAGKSTTLRAVEVYHQGKGLYICRDKSLEMEARVLFTGNNIDIYTSHALALNTLEPDVKNGFMFLKDEFGEPIFSDTRIKPLSYYELIENIDFDERFSETFSLSKHWRKILNCVEQFFYSASDELKIIHLSKSASDHIDQLFKKKKITTIQVKELKSEVITYAKKIAELMLNPESNFSTSHDAYVKYWQLSNPELNYDYIMIDEAQDSSSVLLAVLLRQTCQKLYVGDKYQSINQYRGCINAMDIIPCKSQPLSCSFRYGEKIAALATKILSHDNPEIKITGLGLDTDIIKGSDYNESHTLLYIANSNEALQNILLECYLAGVPAKFVTNKAEFSAQNLKSLLSLASGGGPLIAQHKEYLNFEKALLNPKTNETRIFVELIKQDVERANLMLNALEWSLSITDNDAKVFLTTAHGCKGLEFDHVMLADDFVSAINAFGQGKPMLDSELYLLYVAITRPRMTLVLPDELHTALERNLAFKLNKTPVPEYLMDNLFPLKTLSKAVKKKEPSAHAIADAKKESNQKTKSANNVNEKQEVQIVDTASKEKKASSLGQQPSPQPVSFAKATDKFDFINIEIGRKKDLVFKPDELGNEAVEKWLPVEDKMENLIPMYWQPTNSAKFFNQNLGIVGTMGTGKTQTVKSLLTQLHRQRHLNTAGESVGVLIFDYKDDYVDDDFIQATGAKVLEPDNIPINPFALYEDHRLAPVRTAATFTSTLSKVYRLGPKQEQTLKNCIALAYERKGIDKSSPDSFNSLPPTLRDIIAIYNSQDKVQIDSLTSALSNLHDNEVFEPNPRKCMGLFEALEGQVIVVRLSGLESELQSLVVALLLDVFYIQMHQAGKPKPIGDFRALKKLILVDEADTFMSQDFPALRKILKEAREFGCGCILSTQGLDHFKTSDNSYSDYICSWIVHRLENPTVNQIKATFNMESKEDIALAREQTRSLAKHHSFFIDGDKVKTHMESTAFWKIVQDN